MRLALILGYYSYIQSLTYEQAFGADGVFSSGPKNRSTLAGAFGIKNNYSKFEFGILVNKLCEKRD